jgi:general secretion pathway protein D
MKLRPSLSHQPRRPLITAVAALMLCTTALPAAPALAQSKRSRAIESAITLNFVNAEIDGVARAMGAMLKQQFVVDPRVKGTITLYSEEPMSARDAYTQFLAALRGQGFTVVESSGLYKVVPEADAKLQSNTVSMGSVSRRGDQIITQIFKINHENANNLVPVLRPLISPNNTINANPGNNTLVITDYADNLQRIAKIIATMDTASSGDVEVITLKHAVALDIAPLVQRLTDSSGAQANGVIGMPGLAPGASAGSSSASIMVDQRSNSLLVKAPNPARMASIRALIDKLDKQNQTASAAGNVWVVYLKNADAVRLATVLRAAYPSSSSSGTTGGGGGGGAPATVQTFNQNPGNPGAGTGAVSAQAAAPVVASAAPSTGGFVQADPATNSLIITGPEPMYRQLRAVIDQLDSRRAQVYVESLIVEVDADKSADLGIQWQGILGNNGDSQVVAGGTNFGKSGNIVDLTKATVGGRNTLAAAGVSQGLNIGLAQKFGKYYTLGALANALNTQGGANILSTPNLVTLDNEEAKIVVGRNVPFITGQYTNTGTATTSPFQTIERKDVGITLRLKPQIGENGSVRMAIYQESSSVVGESGPQGPTTNKRSIESTIVVDDGQVIVLGGLIEDNYSVSKSKVPLLGDIPYLGALFRSETRSHKKTNLMVFLRPVVMRDQAASNSVSLDRYDYIRGQQREAQPTYNGIMQVNESPVLPPIVRPATPADQVGPPVAAPPAPPPPLGAAPPQAPPIPASAPISPSSNMPPESPVVVAPVPNTPAAH